MSRAYIDSAKTIKERMDKTKTEAEEFAVKIAKVRDAAKAIGLFPTLSELKAFLTAVKEALDINA